MLEVFQIMMKLLTPFGANKHAEELLAAPPHRTGQTVVGHR
jgi:hypothetical protein